MDDDEKKNSYFHDIARCVVPLVICYIYSDTMGEKWEKREPRVALLKSHDRRLTLFGFVIICLLDNFKYNTRNVGYVLKTLRPVCLTCIQYVLELFIH